MSSKSKRISVKKEEDQENSNEATESLRLIEDLKFFLATAPANWQENQVIRRYYLNHDEGFVSCIFWNNLYFITGTDIVRCIVYKFEHFGRKIIDRKKFEEGIFSDLRSLKCGTDAILEPPRSEFLEFLFKNSCLRTQKKQKVFFWFNVPHDKLMADALERDLKKEKLNQGATTVAEREPATSFQYDESESLYQQLADHMDIQKKLNEPELSSTGVETKSSPEYVSSQIDKNEDNYEFLQGETPAQFRMNSDYEDDFPLDYFDPANEFHMDSNAYISLDANIHRGTLVSATDEKYDSIVDPSIFIHPNTPTPAINQLVYNDEYLIEQTQPLKTPLQQSMKQKPTKFVSSATDEYFQHLPLSSKIQSPYGRQALVSLPQQPQSSQFYDIPGQQVPSMYQQVPDSQITSYLQEADYWQPHGSFYGNPMDQMLLPVNQQYLIIKEQDLLSNNNYQVMNPAMLNVIPQNNYSSNSYSKPSSRQQQISANMMKKKRQMFQQQLRANASVSKHPNERLKQKSYHNLDEVINLKSTRVVNFKESKNSEPTDVLIPTPESSITNLSDNNSIKSHLHHGY